MLQTCISEMKTPQNFVSNSNLRPILVPTAKIKLYCKYKQIKTNKKVKDCVSFYPPVPVVTTGGPYKISPHYNGDQETQILHIL